MSNLLPAERRAFEVSAHTFVNTEIDSDWGREAACRGALGQLDPYTDENQAAFIRNFCQGCPVAEACAAQARAYNERDGVWGGIAYRNGKRFRMEVSKTYDDGTEKLALIRVNKDGQDIIDDKPKNSLFAQLAFELANK